MKLQPGKSPLALRGGYGLPVLGAVLLLALFWGWSCLAWAAAAGSPAANQACVSCHQKEGLDDGGGQDLGPHQGLSCLACHPGAQRHPHEGLKLAPCQSCHTPHSEATTGDLHAGVSCAACHWAGGGNTPHRLASTARPASCQRCHFAGNQAKAPAAVLPAKGVLCLACHTATVSLPEWPSRLALLGLILGLWAGLSFWLSGGERGPAAQSLPHGAGGGFGRGVGALLRDGLLQRRLWSVSRGRWLIHALMVLPFVARLLWALLALLLSYTSPGAGLTQAMLNKNYPATALFFDLTGLLVLAGAVLAILRRALRKGAALPGLPGPDWLGMGLLAGVVLSGFVTEAARLALSGAPAGSGWAFGGLALSKAFTAGPGLQVAYGYLWYAHAIIFAAFVVYLPLGRMGHILLAPLNLALRAGRGLLRRGGDGPQG